jgi:thiopeptide-type bacteriocin biosynthesis protein
MYVEFTDWAASEQTAARHLAPLMRQAQDSGLISGFWFVRKHPCWRLRLRLPPGSDGHVLEALIRPALDGLADSGAILQWRPGIYEAEEAAFGGPSGMAIAHDLFAADSEAVLRLLGNADGSGVRLGRRELSLALCTTLLHAARLEWYEQGDAWHRVTRMRPLPGDVTAGQVSGLTASTATLLASDTSPASPLLEAGGPLAGAAAWAAAFRQAGEDLGTLTRCGTLQRGLREVLSYHVIFHWNRLGLTSRQQAILARACRDAILGPVPAPIAPVTVTTTRRPSAPRPDLDHLTRRFPLVPQPRPACPALETRIGQVRQLASPLGEPADREQRIEQACTALNLAALIASDCRMPALAAELCERQLAVFQAAGPVTGRIAIASLQPLVNLARLDIRAGHGDRAYRALTRLAEAARHGGAVEVHGRSFTLPAAIPADAGAVTPWLRGVLLHDGTRALAAAGHWDQAAEHAARYDDHPGRLHDARQAGIIACVTAGDGKTAMELIDESTRTDPWEHAIAACLRAWAHLATGCPIPDSATPALALARLAIQPTAPGMTLSRIKLSLTSAELVTAIDPAQEDLLSQVADDALQDGDGHAASEILSSPAIARFLPQVQRQQLRRIITAAGLGDGPVPEPLRSELLAGVSAAEAGLRTALRTSVGQPPAPSLPLEGGRERPREAASLAADG